VDLQEEGVLLETCQLQPCTYLNNVLEQDHRFMKRLLRPGLSFWSFRTAWRTLRGYEIMNMIRKAQLRGADRGDVVSQNHLIAQVFGIA
jgi:transposase-like protein